MARPFVAYVVQQFPALRTTFIRREVEALGRLGVPLKVFSIRRPIEGIGLIEPEAARHLEVTRYLPQSPVDLTSAWQNVEWAFRSPIAAFRNAASAAADAGGSGAGRRARLALQVWRGATLASSICALGKCSRVHAQFADGAATTALAAARLLSVPFSFTSHTSFDSPALGMKAREADMIASISEFDRSRLAALLPGGSVGKVHIVHCGVPVSKWRFAPRASIRNPVQIVSVGALDEKKGHDVLIEACAILRDSGMPIRCRIIGGGPRGPMLQNQIERLGLGATVSLLGPCPQDEVRAAIEEGCIFVLACRQAANGDTDGVPVSLMEPMAMGRITVSTRIAGIPELIKHEATGLLAEPGDPRSLAGQIRRACELGDAGRMAMLNAARIHVEREFDADIEAAKLAPLLAARDPEGT